jgi:peptidoglycan/xylan/chitin deacetylase (PgdA/CDA1 family)
MWLHRHHPKVLAYHSCAATEGAFLLGLNVNTSPAQFALHLDFLRRYYRIVPLDALHAGRVPAYAVVLTFDDGYRSVYQEAFSLLRARGLPATVYLVTDVIDNRGLVWVNALLWLLQTEGDSIRHSLASSLGLSASLSGDDFIRAALAECAPSEIESAIRQAAAGAGIDLRQVAERARLYLSRSEITEMASSGITFGNHTGSHPNLGRLTPADQQEELARAEAILVGLPGHVASCAYPFGAHDAGSSALAQSMGMISVMEIGGVNAPLDLGGVARVPVGDATVARLFAELEVVGPAKAWVRRWLGRMPASLRPEALA